MTEPLILPLSPGDPQCLGRNRLIGLLGQGGMGRVYLGITAGGRQVAVKVMHPQFAGDTSFRERFRREAEVAQRVSGPFTARVLDSGTGERTPWLATEYIPGPTLAQLVTGYGPLPSPSVRWLASGLAQALRDIHSRRIVHRDLKPANVILSVSGPRVIDFGIARALDGLAMTATNELLGTVSYMSPEQLAGGEITGQSDVYSLGAVLVYASTGKTPQRNSPAPATPHVALSLDDVPPDLRALIAGCLRASPRQRPSPGEIIRRCGRPGSPRAGDWLPQPAAVFVATRARQQQGNVTTLLSGAKPTPPQPTPAQPGPAPARRPIAERYRSLSTRMATASQRWPLVAPAGLRRWSRLALLLSVVALTEVASRTALAGRHTAFGLPWLAPARNLQTAIEQFTSWLPDPVAHWAQQAGPGARMDHRLAAVACALVAATTIARRARRARAHLVLIKAAACYVAFFLLTVTALRLLQTGFGPLIHIAEYLRWWAVATLAVAAAVVFPLAGRAR